MSFKILQSDMETLSTTEQKQEYNPLVKDNKDDHEKEAKYCKFSA